MVGRLRHLAAPAMAAAFFACMLAGCRKPAPDAVAESKAEPAAPARVERTPEGEVAVVVGAEAQGRIGLTTETLAPVTHQPECVAYGALEEDPSQVFILRAPIAGTLRTPESGGWPAIGDRLAGGVAVGWIEPRMGPNERTDLEVRIAQARADADASAASLSAARASYESKKKLNEDGKIVSDRSLEEAEAKLKTEEARHRAATETVALLEASRTGAARPMLRVGQSGEAVAVHAQPGEAVEAGQVLLRVTRFDHMLARAHLLVGESIDQANARARIVAVGFERLPLPGEMVAQASGTDSRMQGATFLFRVAIGDAPLRPGAAVIAYLPAFGGERTGVVIPRAAVVRDAGRAWAYVQTSDDAFVRREVPTDTTTADGFFTSIGFAAGDRIVLQGADTLLRVELLAGGRLQPEPDA